MTGSTTTKRSDPFVAHKRWAERVQVPMGYRQAAAHAAVRQVQRPTGNPLLHTLSARFAYLLRWMSASLVSRAPVQLPARISAPLIE